MPPEPGRGAVGEPPRDFSRPISAIDKIARRVSNTVLNPVPFTPRTTMNRQSLSALANPFGVCFLTAVVLQAVGVALFLGLHDWGYSIHSQLFSMSEAQFDLAAYYMFGLMKTLGIMLFLVPWAALKIASPWYDEAA